LKDEKKVENKYVIRVVVSKKEKKFYCSGNGSLFHFDIKKNPQNKETINLIKVLEVSDENIFGLTYSQNEEYIACGDNSGLLTLWKNKDYD
jgi:WD40 repeat protein